VAADNAFDQELAERTRIREQAAAEERAAQAAADALRVQQDNARQRETDDDWFGSQEMRQWAARKLSEARYPSVQLIVRAHLAQEKRLFSKGKTVTVIDEAVDAWLVQDGEIDTYDGREVWKRWNGWTAKLPNDSPMAWRRTHLLHDSGLVITFVDVTKVHDYWLRRHEEVPSPELVPRQIRVIRSASELREFMKGDPLYRMPTKHWFISTVEEALGRT
jgi:hypothetical protein